MLDEQRVHGDPKAWVHPFPQGRLGLFGSAGPHDAEPVRDAMHVRVHRDRRDAVPEDEHAVGGLRSDAGKRGEFLERPGHGAAETVEDLLRARPDRARLHPIVSGRADERLDLGRLRSGQRDRVREPGEQPGARMGGVRVPRTLGEDRPDEDLERVLGVVTEVRPSPIPSSVEPAESVEEPLPIERGRAGRAFHPDPVRFAACDENAGAGAGTPGSDRSGSSLSSPERRSSPTR